MTAKPTVVSSSARTSSPREPCLLYTSQEQRQRHRRIEKAQLQCGLYDKQHDSAPFGRSVGKHQSLVVVTDVYKRQGFYVIYTNQIVVCDLKQDSKHIGNA